MRLGFKLLMIAAFCAVALPASPVRAAPDYDTMKAGPRVGTKIPDQLSTVDQNGQHQDFKALAHKRGLVVLFTRSVDW